MNLPTYTLPRAVRDRLARALVALAIALAPVATSAEPNLSLSLAAPPYAFATTCDLAQSLVFINLVVVNRGNAILPEALVTAADSAGALQGSMPMLRLAPGTESKLRLGLRHVASSVGPIGGTHSITVTAGTARLGPLDVTVPVSLCASVMGGPSAPTHRLVTAVLPTPTPSPISRITIRSNALLAALRPAVPVNVHNVQSPQDCGAHIGFIGAFACPDLVRSGHMLLIWDWAPGSGPDDIDGYRIYRVDGPKRLIYTRADKKDLTLVDVPPPTGGYVGTCYAVSAYLESFESALSQAFCPTRAQTMVIASPTVVPSASQPRAPNHVDIHVTDDSYPTDTVVAAGGSVTWINDDGDPHSVYGPAGSFVGELDPHGGRYTTTFRDIGQNYRVNYLCEYHGGMRGIVNVVVNH